MQDQKINSHSKLNCILASIQATQAGADEALMLDPHGFVATCNSTHFFIVRKGEVWTSSGKYCLGGITRALVLEIAREAGIPAFEKDFSLTDVYGADEAFVTGTFAGIVPVREVDGRQLRMPRADGRAAAAALRRAGRAGRRRAETGRDDPPMLPPPRRGGGRARGLPRTRCREGVEAPHPHPTLSIQGEGIGGGEVMTLRIAMWSGPRNLSTAMMRSFGSRSDTFVSDEPFYGCFLKHTGADHPMREEVIAAMDCDWRSVMDTLRGAPPDGSPVWYQKHMWHHMAGPVGYDDFDGFTHAFLIREPERMIASYLRKREAAAFEDFGLERQAEFFEREADRLGHAPPVIDANDVLADPQAVLSKLCAALGIAWDPEMLSWEPGPPRHRRPVGAALVCAVEASTGFGPPETEPVELPDDAQRLADRCRPYYERLAGHRLAALSGRLRFYDADAFVGPFPIDVDALSAHSSRVQQRTGSMRLPVNTTRMQYFVSGVPGGAAVVGGA